jgi:hypothetical protein
VNAQVGGRLAQVGARLIDGVAKRMADIFFEKFKEKITMSESNDNSISNPSSAALTSQHKGKWLLLAAVIAAVFVIYYTTR